MRAINDTECTHLHLQPETRCLALKSTPANLSTCPNSPSCLVDSTRTVYESAESPSICRVRCAIKWPSIMHCGPEPPEMMANHPAPISTRSLRESFTFLSIEAGDFDNFFLAGGAEVAVSEATNGFSLVFVVGRLQKVGKGGWPGGSGEGSNVSVRSLLCMQSEHGNGLFAAIQSS